MTIRSFVPAAAAFLVLGAAGWVLPHAVAQTMWDVVKVTLPNAVTIGDKTVPPGDYTIKQLETASGDSPILLIYNGKGMRFQTSALTIHAVDPNTPQKTTVTLHQIGDNYYLDKVWVAGKNYGYQLPLPKNAKEREAEAAIVSVPAQVSTTTDTTTTDTTTTTATNTDDVTPPPPPPPPAEDPAASTPPAQPTPAPEPQASTDVQQPTPAPTPAPTVSDDNSANREATPDNTPSMPATSAGWLAMLLSGGTLSGAGMMLRRRKQ
jgi:hypothetical protein